MSLTCLSRFIVLRRCRPVEFKIFTIRDFSGTHKLNAAPPKICKQEGSNCKSFLKCGPCSKYKYMDIRCKVALITGGACDTGFAAANEMLCQEAYKVVIADQNVEQGIRAVESLEGMYGKNKACFIPVDFRKPQNFKDLFATIHHQFGGLDILINCQWPLKEFRWDHEIDANVKNTLRGILLSFDYMSKEKKTMKGGVVVNVASTAGLEGEQHAPLFTGINHGVVGLTKGFGHKEHFRKNGVRVVCLCPGKDNPIVPPEIKDPQELKDFGHGPKTKLQPSSKVGNALTYLIRYAPTGSIWVVENSALYKTKIPKRQSFSKTIDIL